MSEHKYYVGLTSLLDETITTSYLWKDLHFYPCFEKSSYAITLKELELLTNEKLARFVGYDDQTEIKLVGEIVDNYWVNPLLKLTPVEDMKND